MWGGVGMGACGCGGVFDCVILCVHISVVLSCSSVSICNVSAFTVHLLLLTSTQGHKLVGLKRSAQVNDAMECFLTYFLTVS